MGAVSFIDSLVHSAELNDEELFAKADELAAKAVDDRLSAGIAFGMVRHGKSIRSGAHGVASADASTGLSPESMFRIASVTKIFVAIAVMKLVEDRQLVLEDTLDRYFEGFPKGTEVSVYQLLSHTSGIKDWWEIELPSDLPKEFPLLSKPHDALAHCKDLFHFAPGTHHWYSNTGFVLLGELIERVSGKKLETFVGDSVLKPAGLKQTAWVGDELSNLQSTQGHHRLAEPTPHFQLADNVGSPRAAGGLLSSVDDMLRLSSHLFAGDLLASETVEMMSQMARLSNGTPVSKSIWHPSYIDSLPEPPEFMQDSGWGLGMSRFTSASKPVVWHSGGNPGYNAIWLNFPTLSTSFAFLANTDNGAVPVFNEVVPLIAS